MKLQTPQNKSYMKNYSSQKYQATNTKVKHLSWILVLRHIWKKVIKYGKPMRYRNKIQHMIQWNTYFKNMAIGVAIRNMKIKSIT